MKIIIKGDAQELGRSAGKLAADSIRAAIAAKGQANIILATGASQFETLNQLVIEKDIDWSNVVMFHLDEYIGLPETSPASFRKYLKERFLNRAPALKAVHLVNGENDPEAECNRLNQIIESSPIDVALVGIGENGHLAFNDPPADFDIERPYIVVNLDDQCRKQQLGEGWFNTIDDVPRRAISMSVKQILRSKTIICSVPDGRKATAVKNTLEQPISPLYPASILNTHPDCFLLLDPPSASLMKLEALS